VSRAKGPVRSVPPPVAVGGLGGDCRDCHRVDFNLAGEWYRMSLLQPHSARGPGGTSHYMAERGYTEEPERAGFIRRCKRHA